MSLKRKEMSNQDAILEDKKICLNDRELQIITDCSNKAKEDAGKNAFFNTGQELIYFIKNIGVPDTIPAGHVVNVNTKISKKLKNIFKKYQSYIENIYMRNIKFEIEHTNEDDDSTKHNYCIECDEDCAEYTSSKTDLTFCLTKQQQITNLESQIDRLKNRTDIF